MFAWSDIFGGQSTAEAEANFASQQAKLLAQTNDLYLDPLNDYSGTIALNEKLLGTKLDDKNAAAASGFVSGLGDGLKNIKDSLTGFGLFKLVPPWLWIVAALVVFFWIGGAAWSKGRLAK